MKQSVSPRLSLAFLVAAVTILVGCSESTPEQQKAERQWPVKVASVVNSGEIKDRQFAGRVKAVQSVDLSFQVGGKLAKLSIREGEIIPKGTLIAELDDRDYQRRVKEARVNVELLEKTLSRQSSLAGSKVISQQQLDETKSNFDLAKVTLDRAEQDLAYTQLRVPFDALATRQLVENYTNVQSGQAIVRLQNISEVRIQISVPEKMLATVHEEQVSSVIATFEFLPGKEFKLEYREHQAEADSVTQTYVVELGMPRPENVQILPGMTARVNVKLKGSSGDLWIPLSAVQSGPEGKPYVWQISADQSVVKVPVALGRTDGKSVQITEGLSPAMKLVAAGGQHLYEGATVRNYAQH
ncbi:efflux RND transporter periplasmic adaptor subunit [Microbulbifer sp. OS29]|uniref:Efflux RND transporter periplasmic adaptor subunit n=1 Tax=Microbulbifer okhotskensis TaxID=2926617 RepID=A0A9X2J394_9GAMM|nr:efflux RND transporter periplasmic adaptor subunit [Microbulbifer okhotskensis]MCO1333312.1 efflux RND transporter periplasmic adaptor subunit [Microbulbifer okhotskensis]